MPGPGEDLLGNAADGVWLAVELSSDGRVVDTSPAFAALVARSRDELRGLSFLDLLAPEERPAAERSLAALAPAILRLAGTGARTLALAPRRRTDGGVVVLAHDVSTLAAEARAARDDAMRLADMMGAGSDMHWELDASLAWIRVVRHRHEGGRLVLSEKIHRFPDEVIDLHYDPAGYAANMAMIRAGRPFRDFLHRQTRPDGTWRFMRTSGVPVHGEDGAFRGYRGTTNDVTAAVETEAALRASEQRFRELFETTSDWYWEMDEGLRFTYFSPNFEKVTDSSPEPFLGRRRTDIIVAGVTTDEWQRHLATLDRRQPFRDFRYQTQAFDGPPRWIKASGRPIFDESGAFRGYRGTAADVTAQVEAEEREQAARRRLYEAIENIANPIVIADRDNRVFACNKAYRRLHGSSEGDTIAVPGARQEDLLQWRIDNGIYKVGAAEKKQFAAAIQERRREQIGAIIELSDGRSMFVDPHRLPGGDLVTVWTDVTALRRAEERRLALEAQLHHSQKLEALGTLAGGVAHDLNNTLVPVMALSKGLAQKFAADESAREQLDIIHQAALRARDLVKQVLAFSRKEKPEIGVMDLADLTLKTMALLRASVPPTTEIVSAVEPIPPILGDPGQLHQVILNLVTNAAQAIGAGPGRILVSLAPAGDGHVRLSVEDDGCGMHAAVLQRVFEPFFTTKEAGEGTGLGLAVVHGIVSSHGGTIDVTSEPGRGTRFEIRLPVQRDAGFWRPRPA